MRSLTCTIVLLLSIAALPARAQETLPAQFSHWTSSGPSVRIGAAAVQQLSGSDAAVLREDGLLDLERRNYEHQGRSIGVNLYRLRDTTGAYAAFTALRTADMSRSDLATFSAIGKTRALLVMGLHLLEVTGLESVSLAEFRDLVSSLRSSAEQAPYPPISGFLPVNGRVPHSEKYFLGPVGLKTRLAGKAFNFLPTDDWLGFGAGAEATFAQYRNNGREFYLLLAEYPTPQAASKRLKQIEQRLSSSGGAPQIIARRKGSLLSMVLNPVSTEAANALLDQVRYHTEVTWNEPTHSLKEPSFNVMIVEAFVGTGVILIFAVIAGVGFGGVRLLTKYLLPGKVFDRGERVEILQLGISSKPIEAKDFY
jgi:uncharacterized protein DUF6599